MCATELKGILLILQHLDAVNDFGVWLVFILCTFEKMFCIVPFRLRILKIRQCLYASIHTEYAGDMSNQDI